MAWVERDYKDQLVPTLLLLAETLPPRLWLGKTQKFSCISMTNPSYSSLSYFKAPRYHFQSSIGFFVVFVSFFLFFLWLAFFFIKKHDSKCYTITGLWKVSTAYFLPLCFYFYLSNWPFFTISEYLLINNENHKIDVSHLLKVSHFSSFLNIQAI